MSRARSTYEGEEKLVRDIGGETWKKATLYT